MLHHVNIGLTVKQCVHQIPAITLEASIQPITRTVLRVRLLISPDFRWNDQVKVVGLQRSSRRPCSSRDNFAGSGLRSLLFGEKAQKAAVLLTKPLCGRSGPRLCGRALVAVGGGSAQ